MKQVVSKGVVFLAIVLPPVANIAAQPKFICPMPISMERKYANDPRLALLKKFLTNNDCPVKNLSVEFLVAADRNGLDWRLLPSIAFIESTGGKAYQNNNIFGWDNGDIRFSSIKEGIHSVGQELANSRFYKGKTLDQKLRTYNRFPHYPGSVKSVMAQIGPAPAAIN